jgi:polyisoprenoid-binding protein YceI
MIRVSGQAKPQENMVCMRNQGRHEHLVSSQLLAAAKYADAECSGSSGTQTLSAAYVATS